MTDGGRSVHLLRNTPDRASIAALERNGVVLRRSTRTGGHIYSHADGRLVVIHFQHGSDTLPRGTLRSVLDGTQWTLEDLRRPRLV